MPTQTNELEFDTGGDLEIRTDLDIADMLFFFSHRPLGLTIQQALEIDPSYDQSDYEPPVTLPYYY